MTNEDFYESERALAQYLLFHYGEPEEMLPPELDVGIDLRSLATSFPMRCVSECVDPGPLRENSRALDLGCAVGRSTFELARHCRTVIGIDSSTRFIQAANHLKSEGLLTFGCIEEGLLTKPCVARVPEQIDRRRVTFEVGDATDLRDHLGQFDVLMMANLLDRLYDPKRCLERIPGLLNPRGQLVIASPYSWSEEFTPRENWLGGLERSSRPATTFNSLREILDKDFELRSTQDLPFLLREHKRRYQLGIAQAGIWRRR
jgi:putative 4-mercaptohistidine N1-methyltranferase